MKRKTKIMKPGKLDIDTLKGFLERNTILDPHVIVGPKIGEDAAVIDLRDKTDHYWVVTSDPITFATEEIGYYGVVVNLNDIATMGATPRRAWKAFTTGAMRHVGVSFSICSVRRSTRSEFSSMLLIYSCSVICWAG